MNSNRIIAQSEWIKRRCPFCFGELGWLEIIKRKIRKDCVCKNCGKNIKERFIVW